MIRSFLYKSSTELSDRDTVKSMQSITYQGLRDGNSLKRCSMKGDNQQVFYEPDAEVFISGTT